MTHEELMQWVNVAGPNDCWEWQGSLNNKGYGTITYKGKTELSHRISYLLHTGKDIIGWVIMHTCDNGMCNNPNHLKRGTQADNVDDMRIKGRASFGGSRPTFGSDNPNSVLNEDKVREIKLLLKSGHRHQDIAEEFGVARSTISGISAGTRWSHI